MSIGFIPEINTREKWKKRNKTVFILGENQIRKNYKSVIFKTLHLVLCTYPPPHLTLLSPKHLNPRLTPYFPLPHLLLMISFCFWPPKDIWLFILCFHNRNSCVHFHTFTGAQILHFDLQQRFRKWHSDPRLKYVHKLIIFDW